VVMGSIVLPLISSWRPTNRRSRPKPLRSTASLAWDPSAASVGVAGKCGHDLDRSPRRRASPAHHRCRGPATSQVGRITRCSRRRAEAARA
jgi:hypothetical protein